MVLKTQCNVDVSKYGLGLPYPQCYLNLKPVNPMRSCRPKLRRLKNGNHWGLKIFYVPLKFSLKGVQLKKYIYIYIIPICFPNYMLWFIIIFAAKQITAFYFLTF